MPKREAIHSIPQTLPCGCRSIIGNNNRLATRLSDGSRLCRLHRKRYVLEFVELSEPRVPEEVPHVER